jgi:hypothetical protein
VTSFFWSYVLHAYNLEILLSNVSVPTGTLCCQFFTSHVIDRISSLDRKMSRDGSVSFGKLHISKTCFLLVFRHFATLLLRQSDYQSF